MEDERICSDERINTHDTEHRESLPFVEDHILDNVVVVNHRKQLRLLEVFHPFLHAPQTDARQAEIEQDLGGKEAEAQPKLLVVSR